MQWSLPVFHSIHHQANPITDMMTCRISMKRSALTLHDAIAQRATKGLRLALVASMFCSSALVASPALARAQQLRELALTTVLTLPSATDRSAPEIGRIARALRLPSGMMVIADDASNQLHVYSASGVFIRTIGREGAGPGEFQSVRWIGNCRSGDAVTVVDQMQNRVTTFQLKGLAKTGAVPNGIVQLQIMSPDLVQCSSDGRIAFAEVTSGGMRKIVGDLVVVDSLGKAVARFGPMQLQSENLLGPAARMALSKGRLYYGDGDNATIVSQPLPAGSSAALDIPSTKRAPTAANTNAAIEYWATKIPGTEADYARMRAMFKKLPVAKTMPAYGDLIMDEVSGSLWVKTSMPGDAETVLVRIGSNGKPNGRLRLPAGIDVWQIANNHIVTHAHDAASGEEFVTVYRTQAER